MENRRRIAGRAFDPGRVRFLLQSQTQNIHHQKTTQAKEQKMNERKWSQKEREISELVFCPGAFFRFSPQFLDFMGLDEAVLLSFLINHSYITKSRTRGGWFWCTTKTLTKRLRMDRQKQYRLLRTLRELRFISMTLRTTHNNQRPKRWIRCNLDYIVDRLTDGEKWL
jgi:hypothetical protein